MLSWELETCLWADLQGHFQEGSAEREGPPPEWVPPPSCGRGGFAAPAQHCSLRANVSSCCRWLCCCHPDVRTHLLQLPMCTEDHGSAPGHHCQIATAEASASGGFSASTVRREPLWEYSTLIVWASLINPPLHYIHMVNSAPREYWLIQISRYFPKRNEKMKDVTNISFN